MKKPDIPRTIMVLIAGGFINSMGNSLMWPLNSLFMHNILGRTLTEAGTIIALQSALSLLGQFISGFLSDRFGARKIMIFGLIGASCTVFLIGLYPIWMVYLLASFYLGS